MGLHRAEVVKQNIEMRRRLWGACLISDRWYCTQIASWLYPTSRSSAHSPNNVYHRVSLSYGHPYMIDVNDCDARLPSTGTPYDLYVDELVRLSIILGRVLKTVYRYSPYSPLFVKFAN